MLMAPGSAKAQLEPAPQPDVQIITHEMIKRAGLVRLSDIFRLLDGWHANSLDGFNQQLYPLGALPGTHPWTLWLNGHRVYMDGFSLQQLNRLPVPLEDIAYVGVSTAPRFIGGIPVSGGVIHVHTHAPEEGLAVRAGYWTGNESGDPGPFYFLNPDLPNVDRLGPDTEASLAFRRGAWGRIGGITRIHFPTDPAVAPRIGRLFNGHPKRVMGGLNLQFHHTYGPSTIDAWAGLTGARDYVYLRPFSREIPAFTWFGQAALRGSWTMNPTWSVQYRGAYASNSLSEREGAVGVEPNWRVDHLNARASLQYRRGVHFVSGGVALDRESATLEATLMDPTRAVRGAFVRYQRTGQYGIQPGVSLKARYDGTDWAYEAILDAFYRIRPIHTFSGSLTYTERFFAEIYDYWHWTRQGASLLDSVGVDYSFEGEPENTRLLTADVRWRLRPTQLFEGRLGAFYNIYLGATIEQRDLAPVDDDAFFTGPVQIISGLSGHVTGGYLSVSYRWQPWLTQRLLYQIQKDVTGEEIFSDFRDAQTNFLARTQFTYTPERSFAMDFIFTYRSPTIWPTYGDDGELGKFFRIDIAATKWAWDQRLYGQVVVRNVLNTPYRTHPIGPSFPLTLLLRFGLRI